MKDNFEKSLALVLKHEGGYVNNPKDPGGMTNLGVTKKVWDAYIGHVSTEAEMRGLTPALVGPLYKKLYWDISRCDELPSGVDYAVFDFAVNAGVSRSIKVLQSALGVTQDGQIGPATLTKLVGVNAKELLNQFSQSKTNFYKSLATFSTFGKGWLNRVASVQTEAATMIV
jgi:lysozyme family protein